MTRLPLLLAAAILAAGCQAQAPVQARSVLRLAGTPLVQALADEYQKALPNVTVRMVPSNNPLTGLQAITSGNADVAVAFADAVYAVYTAQSEENGDSHAGHPGLRAIAVLNAAPLILMTGPRSGIRTLTDLPGHTVRITGPGPADPRFGDGWQTSPGLGVAPTRVTSLSQLVLVAFGVDPRTIHNRPLVQSEAVTALMEGTLDAMFTTVFDSGEIVTRAAEGGVRLLPLEGPPVDRLRREYPFVRPVSIPANTYPLQSGVLHTVGVDLVLVCREDLDPQLVYDVTRAHLNAVSHVRAAGTLRPAPDLDKAPAAPIPLHEGAARYYREWELFR